MSNHGAATNKLIGTWKVVSIEDRRSNGEIIYPLGRNTVGILTYDATGHMAVQLMKMPHPVFASDNDATPTVEEKQAAYDGYIAYYGTYAFGEAEGVVIHHVEGSLDPSYIGSDQLRSFEVSGDRLTLSVSMTKDGEQIVGIRIFERVK